ncbi:MAG: peptidase M19 [Saprospiraceae bacterium]|nr:peptidase M19 [Saprospiraceae bacterium]
MKEAKLIIDVHLDLATNAMTLNRDLTQSVQHIRDKEKKLGWDDFQDRGNGTVALPELRSGRVGLVFATMISRYSEHGSPLATMSLPGWHSPDQAYAYAQCQLAWYRQMEEAGEMVQISDVESLVSHTQQWLKADSVENLPVGYILALEGADSLVTPEYIHRYHAQGLRSIGISHYGPGRYAAGTHSDGSGLTSLGFELLREMNQLNILLDLTHLTDKGFYQAIETFSGPVIASHQNCRALIPGERQFADDQLKVIIERQGVIGGALDAWMLFPDYKMKQDSPRGLGINLDKLVDHFDYICQLAGNCNHIGIGSDLDGLFGTEQSPYDLDTIADLQKFVGLLQKRGYTEAHMEQIFYKNWINLLEDSI